MGKRLLSLAMICGFLCTGAACNNYSIPDGNIQTESISDENIQNESIPPQNAAEDPFAQSEEDIALGAIGHGEANPARAEDGSVLPYEYQGGEFTLDYQFSSEGKLDNIGFLLFLDGKPQAYKLHDTDAKSEYLHVFRTSEKHKENFSFVFTPNTGKKGDTLNLTVISITNPDFRPDMKETSSYGWYQKHLERVLKLHFNEDAPDGGMYEERDSVFRDVSVREEKVTTSYIEHELVKNGWDGVTLDNLDDSVYSTISFDGELVYDNINLTGRDTLTVRYTICGTAGARYGVSFFLDHKPVPFDGVTSWNVTLSKGNVWTLEAVLDARKFQGFHTFYVTAVAAEGDCTSHKTESILLYTLNQY